MKKLIVYIIIIILLAGLSWFLYGKFTISAIGMIVGGIGCYIYDITRNKNK